MSGLQELIERIPDKDTLLASEIAEVLGVSDSTVRRWGDQGDIRYIQIGTRGRRYLRSSVVDFLLRGGIIR